MSANTPEDIKQSIEYIKISALSLDNYTKDLINLMSNLNQTEEVKYGKKNPLLILSKSNLNSDESNNSEIYVDSNLNLD